MGISGMTTLSRAMDDSRSSISMLETSFLFLSTGSKEASVSVRKSSSRLAIWDALCMIEGIKEVKLSDRARRTAGIRVSPQPRAESGGMERYLWQPVGLNHAIHVGFRIH